MILAFEDRLSDSPFVEKVWRSRSDRGGPFVSIAQSHFEMAVTRHQGRTFITLRGPETQATRADCPPDGEWLGIRFRLGTFMPRLTPGELRDRNDVTLPDADAALVLAERIRLRLSGLRERRHVRRPARAEGPASCATRSWTRCCAAARMPGRSVQRSATSCARPASSHGAVRQIERARRAALLLRDGVPILDVVHAAGYYDQAHLTRSLRHRIGLTPLAVEPHGGTAVVSIQNTALALTLRCARRLDP